MLVFAEEIFLQKEKVTRKIITMKTLLDTVGKSFSVFQTLVYTLKYLAFPGV